MLSGVGTSGSPAAGQSPQYRLTDLGVMSQLPGAKSFALGMNNSNLVVGHTDVEVNINGQFVNKGRAFVWVPTPPSFYPIGMNELGLLASSPASGTSIARAISEAGIVVGTSTTSAASRAFIFLKLPSPSQNLPAGMTDLGSPAGSLGGSDAWGVDWRVPFTVVGSTDDVEECGFSFRRRAFSWNSLSHTMTLLDQPAAPNPFSLGGGIAYGINRPEGDSEPSSIAGNVSYCNFIGPCTEIADPVGWQGQSDTVLELSSIGAVDGVARSVDDLGRYAGYVMLSPNCSTRAAFWSSAGGGAFNLGAVLPPPPFPSDAQTVAMAINNDLTTPLVVGFVGNWQTANVPGNSIGPAILWRRSSGTWSAFDLNSLVLNPNCSGFTLREAYDVNDVGSIVGLATDLLGQMRAFLLTPISSCHADADQDGEVNIDDLLIVITQWTGVDPCPVSVVCNGDLDFNCRVDIDDLLLVITNWGPNCNGTGGDPIPETVQDCLNWYSDNPEKLEACLRSIELREEP